MFFLMPITTRRQGTSSKSRWSETDRNRFWQLRNENLELTWDQFQKDFFPDRSVNALCKAYSDIKLQRRRKDRLLSINMSKATISTSPNKDNKRTLDNQETANGSPRKQRKGESAGVHWSPSDTDDEDDDEDEVEDASDNPDTDSDESDGGDIQVNGEATTRLPRSTPKKPSNTDPQRRLSTSPAVERQPRIPILPVTARENNGRTPTEQADQTTIIPPEKPAGSTQSHRAPSAPAPNHQPNSPALVKQDSPKLLLPSNGHPPPVTEQKMPSSVNPHFNNVSLSEIFRQAASKMDAHDELCLQAKKQEEEITRQAEEITKQTEENMRLQKEIATLISSQDELNALLASEEKENALQKKSLDDQEKILKQQENLIRELQAKLAEKKSAAVPVPKCEECVKKDQQIAQKDQQISKAKERQKQLQKFDLFEYD